MRTLRTLLLNLFALLLLPPGMAFGQAHPKTSGIVTEKQSGGIVTEKQFTSSDIPPPYELTELQKARLDAARQEIFRWQDKMEEALRKFSAICTEARKDNHWPEVQCSLTDLAVIPPAPAASSQIIASPAASPAAKPAEAPK